MSLPSFPKLFSFSRADSRAGKVVEPPKASKKYAKSSSTSSSHERRYSSAPAPNIPTYGVAATTAAARWQLAPTRPSVMDEWDLAPAVQDERRKIQKSSSKEKRPYSKRSVSATSEGGKRKKSQQRSSSAAGVFDYLTVSEEPSARMAMLPGHVVLDSDSSGDTDGGTQTKRSSVASNLTAMTDQSNGSSGSSSGSGSTLTQASYTNKGKEVASKENGKSKKLSTHKPDALSFLDPDSPEITKDIIQHSIEYSDHQSPTSSNGSSSSSRSTTSYNMDNETDRSTSPERTPDKERSEGNDKETSGHGSPNLPAAVDTAKLLRKKSYGTPEMPRGNVKLPHLSPSELTARIPHQGQGHAKLPRAEKLPMTGYELLASRLTAQSGQPGPHVRPMYRRFETLNHRLLLHLQDELCELEEQLHRLDTADTQNRRFQDCIRPASRRAEYLTGGELQWHKTDILGKIGFKLEQYNHVLSSFKTTQTLPTPTLDDINEYRNYLSTHEPIAAIETRFLDAADDLVCVSDGFPPSRDYEGDSAAATPMPRNFNMPFPMNSNSSRSAGGASEDSDDAETRPYVPLSLAMAAAVVVPVLTFSVIPGYLGRMTVVLLVGLGILGILIQGGVVGIRATRDFVICAGFYGGIMSSIAAVYQ